MSLRQWLRLPVTLIVIARQIRRDCCTEAADASLQAFRGFHLEPGNSAYRARPWQPVQFGRISASDVVAFHVREMATMMHVAMEIEDPIVEYSHQNGEGFRFLLPGLARFMGRNTDEADFARAHGLRWCEGAWCAEERRHGPAFAKAIERLTSTTPARDNPNEPKAMTADEDSALAHLISREAAEWSSSSTYTAMAAHANGMLHTLLRNMARDEIKHLCILSAADVYLRGPGYWRRFGELLRIGAANFRGQQRRRSLGRQMAANTATRVEVVAAHLMMEWRLRRWLAGLSLDTLRIVFETDSPSIAAGMLEPAEQARIDARLALNRQRRKALSRWQAAARRKESRRSLAEAAGGRNRGEGGNRV